MFKCLTEEEFQAKLIACNVQHKPLDKYQGAHTQIKWQCGKNPNHIFKLNPCRIYDHVNACPYCDRRKVFIGETDIWTTRPDMARLLVDPNDGYKHTDRSGVKLNWKCPECDSVIKQKSPAEVYFHGLTCVNCGDGRSYGEKLIMGMLVQMDIGFVFDRTTEWSCGKRYDFYIPSKSLIIEVHGVQHYDRSFTGFSNRNPRTVQDEQDNDQYKKELALRNGIRYYVQLDCRKSKLDYIRDSVYNSELSLLFDLSIIDWSKCGAYTLTSDIKKCAELWQSGMTNTRDISCCTGIHISSVIAYLKKASEIGLCDYVMHYKKNRSRYKPVMCLETGRIYECIRDVKIDGYNGSYVSDCCNHKRETAYGLHWQFI